MQLIWRTVARSRGRAAATAVAVSLGVVTALTLSLGGGLVTAGPAHAADGIKPNKFERRVHRLINAKREKRDLKPVRFDDCADGYAERWSRKLALELLFFHQDLEPILDGCDADYVGENLARGTLTPRQTVRMWMQSPGHRKIMLSKRPNRVGVGVRIDALGRYVITADFVKIP